MNGRITKMGKSINIGQDVINKINPKASFLDGNESCGKNDTEETNVNQLEALQQDLQRRQESYIRRERQYKTKIEELENQLKQNDKVRSFDDDEKMIKIRSMHKKIIDNVEQVQQRTSSILQEQEKDLLRAFRARLYDVQTELEKEKNKTDDGTSAWIERSKQLEAEADWAKQMADRLDRINQTLTRENQRLKTQFTTQENDREFLVRQLVAVKKDNARLRIEYEQIKKDNEVLSNDIQNVVVTQETIESKDLTQSNSILPRPGTSCTTSNQRASSAKPYIQTTIEADNRYKEIIKRLKRLLEVERRNLRQVRTAYTNELQERTELETFLRKCIDDVKLEMMKRKNDPKIKKGMENILEEAKSIPFEAIGTNDRERVLEKLLSQERVINLLYSKTFPIHKSQDDEDVKKNTTNINIPKPSEEDIQKIYSDAGFASPTKIIA